MTLAISDVKGTSACENSGSGRLEIKMFEGMKLMQEHLYGRPLLLQNLQRLPAPFPKLYLLKVHVMKGTLLTT